MPAAMFVGAGVVVIVAVVVALFFLLRRDSSKESDDREPLWDSSGPSRWTYFLEMPLYMKIFILIAVILGLNIALFLPLGFTAVVFELWLGLLQLVKLQLPLWIYALIAVPLFLVGIYLVPRIEIPDAGEGGIRAIYLRHTSDGAREYFHTWSPHGKIKVNRAWVRRIGLFRFVVVGKVKLLQFDDNKKETTVQSEQLEVEQDEALKEENRILKKEIKQMRRDHAKGGVYMTRDHFEKLMEHRRD